MDISQVIETEEGKVTFNGVLEGSELQAVITVGLLHLFKVGALPLLTDDRELATIAPSTRRLT